jgi:hypothetical protein
MAGVLCIRLQDPLEGRRRICHPAAGRRCSHRLVGLGALRLGTETGYGIAWITPPLRLREQGLFSISHVPTNLALFIGGGYGDPQRFPLARPEH